MRKYRVRVVNTQERQVPVYQYVYDLRNGHVNTGKVIRTDLIVKKNVMFSGSPEAYRIWRAGHSLPATAVVTERPIKDEDDLVYAPQVLRGSPSHSVNGLPLK